MRNRIFILFSFLVCASLNAQLSCEGLMVTGIKYTATSFKHGKGKLMTTDTAITNKMQLKEFMLKKVSELNAEEKAEISKYKIKFNETDTVMFYDWDIIHEGKLGYFGKAVAKVRIICADSMMYTYKYLLNKNAEKYVPNQFKIIRLNENNFIINDRYHPYLNINYYFRKLD